VVVDGIENLQLIEVGINQLRMRVDGFTTSEKDCTGGGRGVGL
jgi:hypothetical protein